MTYASVASNLLQSLYVHSDLSSQITLNYLTVSDDCRKLLNFVVS